MKREIKDLTPGQSAWTLPWALHEVHGRKWLHPEYPAYSSTGGTVQMKVIALAPGIDQVKRYYAHTGGREDLGVTVELAPFGGPVQDERDPDDPDADHPEEHETWLEYHDRLVKEYYDVDAEWALVKEICPELDRPEPAPELYRPRRGLHPYHGVAAAWTAAGLFNLWFGSIAMAVFWFALGTMFLALVDGRGRR